MKKNKNNMQFFEEKISYDISDFMGKIKAIVTLPSTWWMSVVYSAVDCYICEVIYWLWRESYKNTNQI